MSEENLPVEEPNSSIDAPIEPITLPGAWLRRARESAGLSVAEVAQTLKFSPRQIDALERDDFSALQGATFVRGFIRSYAKTLKVDPTPLLASLQEAAPPVEAKIQAPENTGAELPVVRQPRNFVPLLLAVAVLVLGGVAVFMILEGHWALPTRNADMVATPPAVPVAPPQVRIESAPTQASVPEPVAAEAKPDAPPPPVAVPALDGRQLIFVFQDKSWVEVKDATQRIIFTGEHPAGSRNSVTGKAPFQLWVGKASGVKVFDGEREIDLKPYARDEVARLTID
ncbi:MAG: helix-turn-helix domain-containing protein [Rhodocyclaceae bacterium]|nr:helix-turn-helix domain-containing protein [Rhodocyclaceae bacterium]